MKLEQAESELMQLRKDLAMVRQDLELKTAAATAAEQRVSAKNGGFPTITQTLHFISWWHSFAILHPHTPGQVGTIDDRHCASCLEAALADLRETRKSARARAHT